MAAIKPQPLTDWVFTRNLDVDHGHPKPKVDRCLITSWVPPYVNSWAQLVDGALCLTCHPRQHVVQL